MKYATRTVQQHTVKFSNDVTVTREDVGGLLATARVQVENAKTTVACLKEQLKDAVATLVLLEEDMAQLNAIEQGEKK